MAATAARARRPSGRARSALRERLEARRGEIEAAALTRVSAISDPSEISDPAYAEGLRAAVRAAISYGIETTGREGAELPIPVALLAQARMAARAGVPVDTVLRRYFAGYSLLGYFVLEEAGNAGMTDGTELQRLLGAHAGIFDRLLAAVGEEHARELEACASAAGGRRLAERIERLLSGETADTSEIPYDFDGWHVGLAAAGSKATERLRDLAATLDCRLLAIERTGGAHAAWLGARRAPEAAEVCRLAGVEAEPGVTLAVGEPGQGIAGWRLTHRQATAALSVAQRAADPVVRYRDVAVLASVLQDDLLVTSLRRLYLEPLATGHDQGESLRQTLRAYFAADRNVSSAAARLSVKRHTVTNRLREVEARVGRSLSVCVVELDLALCIHELVGPVAEDGMCSGEPSLAGAKTW